MSDTAPDAALRDQIAQELHLHCPARPYGGNCRCTALADAVMPVVAAALTAARDETTWEHERAEALEVDLRQERAVHQQTVERAEKAEARLVELESALNWQTSCTSCSRLLDSGYAETMRAEQAEAAVQRSREALAVFDGRGVSTPEATDWNIPTAGEVLDAWRASLAALDRPAAPPDVEPRVEPITDEGIRLAAAATRGVDVIEVRVELEDPDVPEHTGGNAEDCPVCRPLIDQPGGVPYPWICTAADRPADPPAKENR